jgi:hypothetical protein
MYPRQLELTAMNILLVVSGSFDVPLAVGSFFFVTFAAFFDCASVEIFHHYAPNRGP